MDELRAGEARVLEMVAADLPLEQVLDALARVFEAQAEGMLASILLVEDGTRVRHGAAPSLPEPWVRAVDGEPIGPDRGSCGTAAYLKKPVVVTDVATDPRWALYRDAALGMGLRACWAVPIMASDDEVLGTFALYYTEPRSPTPRLLELAHRAGHLAAVAIKHHQRAADLKQSEERSRLIVEHALDASVLMDRDGIVTSWNQRATAIFGWTARDAVGRSLSSLIIPPRFREEHERGLRHYLATGEGPILGKRIEIAALHRDGHELPVELAVAPIRHGDHVLFSAFIEDISARRQAQEAARDYEQHLSLVYDHVADVLFQLRVEPEGYRFISVNPAFSAVTGLAAGDIVGRLVHEVIPEPSRSLVLGKYAQAIRERKTVRWEETTPYPTGTKHGDVAITPVFTPDGQPKLLIGSVRDVTDRRQMEDQMRQLQKLEAIGRLAGGIAHDFNNILGVIMGMGNLLQGEVQDPALRDQAEEIVRAAERGAHLTRQFLAFSRKQVLVPEVVDLNDVVRGLETMLRRLIRADIELRIQLTPGLWLTKADRGQIEQVVVNLVVNARDAMPLRGQLAIETANVVLDDEFVRGHLGASMGPFVALSVTDTGHGMDEETKKRIFEPFFTTKEVGKGTGLGLATVYGIVKQSGGYIAVESETGRGTRFTVYLPRSTADRPSPASGHTPARTPAQRLAGIHVLVVEDETALQRTIERMLRILHCEVTVTRSGDEALAAVRQHAIHPDLLITDVILPGIRGIELAEQLRVLQPGLKVLLMSGYAGDSLRGEDAMERPGPFLQKPFGFAELQVGIREALGAS